MKQFNIVKAPGVRVHGRELPIGAIYGNYRGTTYVCQSLFQPKPGYIYIDRYLPAVYRQGNLVRSAKWTGEEPVRSFLTEYVLAVCSAYGITTITTVPVTSFLSSQASMHHPRGFKKQGHCQKTAGKLRAKRGDSPDYDRWGNYGFAIFKDTAKIH